MNKIQSIGNLWNPIRQNLDLVVHSRVGQKWENFINIFNSQKLMIFTENRTTCKEVKVTRFCRMEFQRPPNIPEVSSHIRHTIYWFSGQNVTDTSDILMAIYNKVPGLLGSIPSADIVFLWFCPENRKNIGSEPVTSVIWVPSNSKISRKFTGGFIKGISSFFGKSYQIREKVQLPSEVVIFLILFFFAQK